MDPNTRARLVNVLTEHDRRQSTRKGYNRYALAHYMRAIGDVAEQMNGGATLEDALPHGFCGSLLRHVAKKIGIDREYAKWQ